MKASILFVGLVMLLGLSVTSWADKLPPPESERSSLSHVEVARPASTHLFLLAGAGCGKGNPPKPAKPPAKKPAQGKSQYDKVETPLSSGPTSNTTSNPVYDKVPAAPIVYEKLPPNAPKPSGVKVPPKGGKAKGQAQGPTLTGRSGQYAPAPAKTGQYAPAPTKTGYDKVPSGGEGQYVPAPRTEPINSKARNGQIQKRPAPRLPSGKIGIADSTTKTIKKIGSGASTIPKETLKERKKESAAELKAKQKAAKEAAKP